MKVILNIEGVTYPLTGVGRYIYELGMAMQRSGELKELLLWNWIKPVSNWPTLEAIDHGSMFKFSRYAKSVLKKIPRLFVNTIELKNIIRHHQLKKYNNYLYHGPNFYLPPKIWRQISTIHDLSFVVMPEYHTSAMCRAMYSVLDTLENRADFLITVSEFSRQEIIKLLSWPPDKVVAVPNAPAPMFVPQSLDMLAPKLAELNLRPQGYCLYVGTVEPRKNIALLLDAFESLPDRIRQIFPLVVAGHRGWKSQDVHERLEKLANAGWVRYLGFCPSGHLPFLMAGAAVFLFPSLYEGFGLPPLEAMSCGVPTIVSDRASLPEVVGPGMPCLDAENVDIWRETILRCLEDEKWRQELSVAGLQRAAEFSWVRSAKETIECYNKVVNS
jgi:alpha-1,3-rhamnosyl/mannosyltransferase